MGQINKALFVKKAGKRTACQEKKRRKNPPFRGERGDWVQGVDSLNSGYLRLAEINLG